MLILTNEARSYITSFPWPIGQRCVLSVLRYAFCDGGGSGVGGGGVGGGGGGSGVGSGGGRGSVILSPRMIPSSYIVRFQRKMKRHDIRTHGQTDPLIEMRGRI